MRFRGGTAVAVGAMLVGTMSGCGAVSGLLGGLDTVAMGETVEVPAGVDTAATVEVTVRELEKAPEEISAQFGKSEVWFADVTFQRGDKELEQYDWDRPWGQVLSWLDDDSALDMASTAGADLGRCQLDSDQEQKLVAGYAAGEEIEVCVPVFAEGAELVGAFFGDSAAIDQGVVWEK